jgi:pimeloyl-ACP methyl ester carboxylesterase
LHGFADTGDMWAPLATVLVKDHTVIVPDLRGMGLSDHPDTGCTKKSFGAAEAEDLRFVASNVTGGIVPHSGHWIMEERPKETIEQVTDFLALGK